VVFFPFNSSWGPFPKGSEVLKVLFIEGVFPAGNPPFRLLLFASSSPMKHRGHFSPPHVNDGFQSLPLFFFPRSSSFFRSGLVLHPRPPLYAFFFLVPFAYLLPPFQPGPSCEFLGSDLPPFKGRSSLSFLPPLHHSEGQRWSLEDPLPY